MTPSLAYTTTGCKWPANNLNIFGATVGGDARTALNQAASSWSAYSNVNLAITSFGQFSAASTNSGATGWEGQATWNCPIGMTISASARLNTYYTDSYPTARKKVVWLHELAHGLGLNHVNVVARVMYTSASAAYNAGVRNPTTDDVNGINSLYR